MHEAFDEDDIRLRGEEQPTASSGIRGIMIASGQTNLNESGQNL